MTAPADPPTAKWRWYSICSMHRDMDAQCYTCHTGHWINEADPTFIADQQLFKDDPDEWRRRANQERDRG